MKTFLTPFIILFTIILSLQNVSAQTGLNIGTDDWPPYEFKQNETITGYSTEIVKAVLDKMKINIDQLTIYRWSLAEKFLFNGEIDALYSSSKSEKREKYCHFPEEFLVNSPWVIFIRSEDKDKLKFDSFEDLKGKKIGVVKDYAYTNEFWDFVKKEKNFNAVSSDRLNFKKLISKQVDYIVCEYAVGLAIAKDIGVKDKILAFTDNPIKVTGLYIMFSKKTIKKNFADSFSNHLKQFKTTDEYKTIYNNYFK